MTNPKLRRGRASQPGAYYAVTTVTHRRQSLFTRAPLARIVAAGIDRSQCLGHVEAVAWVVMPDHVHWLFQLHAESLSRVVQSFKAGAARAINVAAGAGGCVWQSGFYDHRLRDDEDLLAQARYPVANPLRRGLVERIEDYPF